MKLPISARLLACASLIEPGQRVADVGTDHGYLAIHLLMSKTASHVYASDVSRQPLLRAKNNAARFGITEGLSLHLTDGVRGLPRDFDVLVLAGMGAETMEAILDGGPWLKNPRYRLVLQCQSSQNGLRHYLAANGWQIRREEPVLDGRLYTVMEVVRGEESLTPGQEFVSPALLRSGSELTGAYIRFCKGVVGAAVSGLQNKGGERYEYYAAVLQELEEMEKALPAPSV